jgi:hypothetical protein
MASFSSWRNPVTAHNDFELPNLVAPAVNVDSNSTTNFSGTSASSPITLGATLLTLAYNNYYFTGWPEMMRAAVLATATHPVDPAPPSNVRTTTLPPAASDIKQGAGLLNADALLNLSSWYYSPPGSFGFWAGYYAKTYTLSRGGSDFDSTGLSYDTYNIAIPSPDYAGNRLRVVIAWDSTASGCTSVPPGDCTGDTLDADLDLYLYKGASLSQFSTSWDSSWEIVDVAVSPGDNYTARLQLNTASSAFTYVGIAWWTYNTANE